MILNRKDIFKQYPWLNQKNQKFIISADYNGIICASFLNHILGWQLVGYYNLESLWISEELCNDYNEVINLISKKKPKFIFFSGTSLYKNLKKNSFVVKQVNVWPQINYCFFFQYKYFFKLLEERNYKLVFKKNNLNDRVINYSNISKSLNIKINYTDLLFKFNG